MDFYTLPYVPEPHLNQDAASINDLTTNIVNNIASEVRLGRSVRATIGGQEVVIFPAEPIKTLVQAFLPEPVPQDV